MKVDTLAVDFRAHGDKAPGARSWLPRAGFLADSARTLREMAGLCISSPAGLREAGALIRARRFARRRGDHVPGGSAFWIASHRSSWIRAVPWIATMSVGAPRRPA